MNIKNLRDPKKYPRICFLIDFCSDLFTIFIIVLVIQVFDYSVHFVSKIASTDPSLESHNTYLPFSLARTLVTLSEAAALIIVLCITITSAKRFYDIGRKRNGEEQ